MGRGGPVLPFGGRVLPPITRRQLELLLRRDGSAGEYGDTGGLLGWEFGLGQLEGEPSSDVEE